jgi:hypothetical protein
MNDEKRNASIEYILDCGLAERRSTPALMREMFANLGLRYMFWDTAYSLIFAALTLAIVTGVCVAAPPYYRCSAAFAAAPMMFLLITGFAETSERMSGLFELKQTCRYTVRQVAALRTICYSVAGIAFIAITGVAIAGFTYEFFALFTLSLTALSVCAALSLSVMRFVSWRWANVVCPAVWGFASVALPVALGGRWERFLSGVPMVAMLAVVAICAGLFAYQASKMLSEGKGAEVKGYAHA